MDVSLERMSVAELAALQSQFGTKVICREGCYWRRVRPWFYRPLLPFEALAGPPPRTPQPWPCGFQYAVSDAVRVNSTMNFVMLDDPGSYSIETVGHKRRNLIKAAARRFVVRPVGDLAQLKAEGYAAFRSFHARTRYAYRADRMRKANFEDWAETLFAQPKALLLGGFAGERLVAVSCSYWVNTTLIYATLFSGTEALRQNLGELLFHELRSIAAAQAGIGEIFVRAYQGGNSLDCYYLLRGCRLVRKPARLELSGAVRALLRVLAPRTHAALCGAV